MKNQNYGEIISINISKKKGERKLPISSALILNDGIENDAHREKGHRQISILSNEDIEKIKKEIPIIKPGDFGENITVKGLDLSQLNLGDKIKIISNNYLDEKINKDNNCNNITLEVTQIGKDCIHPCSIFTKLGYCIMPEKGIFCKVVSGGKINIGDKIFITKN